MAPDHLGRTEMDALNDHTSTRGQWLLLEKPGASTWRLTVRPSKQQVRDGQTYFRRYVTLTDVTGRKLAHAARTLHRELRNNPPEKGSTDA
jgi:hypothetical protein